MMTSYFVDESDDGYGRVFVPRGPWQPGYTDLIKKRGISGLRLSASMGWSGTNLDFLGDLSDLIGIEIYAPGAFDSFRLSSLHRLRLIGLDCKLVTRIDFSDLRELEVVKATWTRELSDVITCVDLVHLNIANWPFSDLESLSRMSRLARLQITSRKLGSLSGVEALMRLTLLDLHACPSLTSIEGLRNSPSITHLEVTACKRIRDITAISALESLRELHLDDNGEIDSLEPITRCRLLRKLSFFGTTKIADGKLSHIERLPELKTLQFAPRRHYDRTRAELLSNLR